jgi:hypothetical protein
MKLTAAFVAHEGRTQGSSLRFRVLAALYAGAGSVPAAVAWLRRDQLETAIGAATYAAETLDVVPALTAVIAVLISLDAITREQDEGAWSTASLAGMSSAGYLLRRWLALQALLLPLTAIPLAVAALAAGVAAASGKTGSAGLGTVPLGPFVGPWLMHVVPIAMTFSALALGVGTIAGGALNAFLLGAFALVVLPQLMNVLLARFGVHLGDGWLSLGSLGQSVSRLVALRNPENPWANAFPLAVSEAPYDYRVAGEQYLAGAAVPVALAAAALGGAGRYLRRTRPDVRPWRIPPEHSLRTFLNTLGRLRERYTPDPAPARTDLWFLGLALLVTAGASTLIVGRARYYDRLGTQRFRAEEAEKTATTPVDVVPGRWRVAGALGPGRGVALTVTAEMRNVGREPRTHLAFALNPRLAIVEARAGEGGLTLSRSWDRLLVELTPPIPAGGSREITFRLRGEPAGIVFPLPGYDYLGFYQTFGRRLHARFARDLPDLSVSYRVPAISARRIDLRAADLTPVPRYHPWQLDGEQRIEEETFAPQADLALDLAAPPGVFLADACGGTLRPAPAGGRLAGGCRMPLTELAVAGGRYRLLGPQAGGTTVAVLPAHAALGELHLGFLARGARQVEEAWPGLGDLRRIVVIEWPGDSGFSIDPIGEAWNNRWSELMGSPLAVRGNLVLLSEGSVVRASALKPEWFAAELVASRLSHRRQIAAEDGPLFRQLFRALALQRLGLGPESGAAVSGLRPGQGGVVRIPPPKDRYSNLYWGSRFPALVAGLRHRMGEEALRQAIDDALSGGSPGDGGLTRADLFAALERHGGPDLQRFVTDNLVKGGLAEPVLDEVEFRVEPGGWRVTGKVVNRGDAEALCKVELTTDLGPVEALVRAEAVGAGAFELRTSRRPQAVLLDPDRECHRLVPNAAPRDRVFFQENPAGTKR